MAITINVKTMSVHGWDRRNPMARNAFGDATPGYVRGWMKPNYPVPALSRVEINERGVYLYDVCAEQTAWFGPLYAWRISR